MLPYLSNLVFIVFASLTLIALGTTLGNFYFRAKRSAIEAELKMEMIRQGMSADDICRVIRAAWAKRDHGQCGRRSGRAKTADV